MVDKIDRYIDEYGSAMTPQTMETAKSVSATVKEKKYTAGMNPHSSKRLYNTVVDYMKVEDELKKKYSTERLKLESQYKRGRPSTKNEPRKILWLGGMNEALYSS